MNPTLFNPSEPAAGEIIHALGDPDTTLRGVAESHGTNLESLVAWMARPDIAERLNNIESGVTRRTRLVANNFLPATAATVAAIVQSCQQEEQSIPINSVRGLEQRRRARETACRATTILMRLATFGASPPRRHKPTDPLNRARRARRTLDNLFPELINLAADSAALGTPTLRVGSSDAVTPSPAESQGANGTAGMPAALGRHADAESLTTNGHTSNGDGHPHASNGEHAAAPGGAPANPHPP